MVARVASLLASLGCDIRAAEVYGDADTGSFFGRTEFDSPIGLESVCNKFFPLAQDLRLDWDMKDLDRKVRVLIAVSKFGHCLVDLINKQELGQLPIEIVGVVSNHEVMRKTVEWHGLPYHHLPMSEGKEAVSADGMRH